MGCFQCVVHTILQKMRKIVYSWSALRGKRNIWGILWKMVMPNAEKKFMWRACNDLLPTKVNLYRRKIVDDDKCPICNMEGESVCHILWTCPSAMDVWGVSIRQFHKCSFREDDFLRIDEMIQQQCETEHFILFIQMAWKI